MKEQADGSERVKALDYDLSRSQARVEDLQKLIDGRNYELRNKEMLLEDAQREFHRVQDDNNRLHGDNSLLRSEMDRQTAENYEMRKQLDFQSSKTHDLGSQAKNLESSLREREEQAYSIRRDLEIHRAEQQRLRLGNVD
jgi:chromosome segregation ATPase